MNIVKIWHKGKQRDHEQREWTQLWHRSEMGKTRIGIRCPFCSAEVTAYVWSISGGGKRCSCGAMFSAFGKARKLIKEKKPVEVEQLKHIKDCELGDNHRDCPACLDQAI